MNWLLKHINPSTTIVSFAVVTLVSVAMAVYSGEYYLGALPFLILGAMFFLLEFKMAFLLLFFFIPLSIEFEVGDALATDLPTEPLMVLLMGAGLVYFMANPKELKRKFIFHPITVFLLLHVAWIGISIIYSQIFIVSLKFLLAKIWYVSVFYFLTFLFLKKADDFKAPFWCLLIPLVPVIIQTLARHAMLGFDFREANHTMQPFFRNHVNYAVILVVLFPFLFFAKQWYKKGSLERLFINLSLVVFIAGIIFAYTRAAYVCLFVLPIAYYLFKYRLVKWVIGFSLITLIIGISYYATDSRYVNLAPDFEKTVYAYELNDHFAATFEGTDVSFMERVYRWVAAFHMVADKPVVGFGPGNFYNFYKYYTVDMFQTYVSDNPEKSGVHNYFLMVLVDQGIVGLVLFLLLCIAFFVIGENIYHQLSNNDKSKSLVMCLLLSQLVIMLNLLMGDLIEIDKIGTLFFMNFALLVNMDLNGERYATANTLSATN